jgi:hypothetical protein
MSPELSQRDRHLIEKRLVDLKIGQAYLKKKGEYPVIITTARVPEVRASSETVEMIRNASYAKYARSRVEVEAEIQRRIEQISGLEIPPVESKDIHQPLDQQDDLQEGFDEW